MSMDKVKQQLAVVLKHGFWIGCAVSALLAIGAWYQATSTLSTQAKTQKELIKNKASAVKTIMTDGTPHPNDASLKGMDDLNKAVALNVKDGWKKVYDLQREELVWPDTFDKRFHSAVDNLRPIEIVPFPTPQEKEINPDFQRQYRDYILEVIPKLAKTVGTEWKAVRQSSSAGGAMSSDYSAGFGGGASSYPMGGLDQYGKPIEDKSLVHWNVSNQQEIQNTHFGFAGRVDPPKTLEILYAQEDLWVLQTLTEIIASTNKGSEFYHESAIKDIDYIRIGRNAGGVSGQVTRITASVDGSGSMTPMTSGSPASDMMSVNPMMSSPMGPGATAVAVDPAEYRYVDADFKPLKAAQVRSVVTSATVSEKDAVLAVAKRMPVRMRVTMDQRKLPLFLSECANSRLPVEVKQVRINRPPGSSASGGASSYGSSPMGAPDGGMLTPFGGSGGMLSQYGGGSGQRGQPGPDPNSITAELFGIIYIYNPPNDAQLGIQDPTKTAGAGSTADNLAAR
jgi:hypothetical protein